MRRSARGARIDRMFSVGTWPTLVSAPGSARLTQQPVVPVPRKNPLILGRSAVRGLWFGGGRVWAGPEKEPPRGDAVRLWEPPGVGCV